MSSIWNTLSKKQEADKPSGKKARTEITDEIREFRDKKKAFEATNEKETYVVLQFSTDLDRAEFVRNVLPKKATHIFLDGYEVAKAIGKKPIKPSLKLPKPLSKE